MNNQLAIKISLQFIKCFNVEISGQFQSVILLRQYCLNVTCEQSHHISGLELGSLKYQLTLSLCSPPGRKILEKFNQMTFDVLYQL